MSKRWAGRLVVLAIVVVSVVGMIDSVFTREWDLFVLFAAIAGLGVVQLLLRLTGRAEVTLRADLDRVLTERSHLTGEPLDQVVDRAVATYLDALADPPAGPG